MNNIKHGEKLRVCGRIGLKIRSGANVNVGYNFLVFSGNMVNPMGRNVCSYIKVGEKGVLDIGDYTGMSSAVIWCDNKVTIGKNVKIGALVIITDTDAHSINPEFRRNTVLDRNNTSSSPVRICDNVLIGTNSIVLKGVTIGENSVIGAGSVVTRDIPANVIAAGNPCKVIRAL
jgi:acetyltransferase-like isoleucine patch superfamily enzyme